jgi:hypothetical protein
MNAMVMQLEFVTVRVMAEEWNTISNICTVLMGSGR